MEESSLPMVAEHFDAALRACDLFEDAEKVSLLAAEGGFNAANAARIGPRLGVTADNVEKLYAFGKAMYDCGTYSESATLPSGHHARCAPGDVLVLPYRAFGFFPSEDKRLTGEPSRQRLVQKAARPSS